MQIKIEVWISSLDQMQKAIQGLIKVEKEYPCTVTSAEVKVSQINPSDS